MAALAINVEALGSAVRELAKHAGVEIVGAYRPAASDPVLIHRPETRTDLKLAVHTLRERANGLIATTNDSDIQWDGTRLIEACRHLESTLDYIRSLVEDRYR